VPEPAWRDFDRVPNRVFAKFRPTVGEAAFDAVLADMDATISSTYRLVPDSSAWRPPVTRPR